MYDPACAVLALHFLPVDATNEDISRLAQSIQDHIEDELAGRETVLVIRTSIRPEERE